MSENVTNQDYFSIIFGEGPDAVDIGKMVDAVINIDRGIGSGWNNEYSQGLGRYGQTWVRGKLSSKTVSFDFIKEGDQRELTRFRREMAAALDCPNGPKRLTFNDQPNAYYMAVTEGTITLREDIRTMQATGTITFVVPDGLLHSSLTTVLTEDSDESIGRIRPHDDHIEVTINNPSSVEVYPKITLTHVGENGYIGIVNQNGVLEVGSKQYAELNSQNLSQPVTAATPLRVNKGDTAGWGLFQKGPTVAEQFITSPHDSDMSVRISRVDYVSNNVNFSVGSPVTNTNTSSATVGNVPQKTQTYMGKPDPKGFAAKLVLRYVSTNAKEKTSVVHADLYIVNVTRAYSFTEWDINYTVKVGASTIHWKSRPNMAPQYGGKWEEHVMSDDHTVKHNPDGTLTVDVLGAINGHNQQWYVPGYFQVNGKFTLPTISTSTSNSGQNLVNGYKGEQQTISGYSWLPQAIPNSAYKWGGGIATYTLPQQTDGSIPGARNFRCDFNIKFWEDKVGQTGRITVGFLDKNNKLICAYDISKDDTNGEDAKVNFYVGKDDIIESVTFGANNSETNQSKPNVAFNNRAGNVSVTKEGSRVTFTYGDRPFTYNVAKLDNKECVRIYISSGALYAARDLSKLVKVMTVESITFTNTNGQRYDAIPNKYKPGSKVVIDNYNGQVLLFSDPNQKTGQLVQSDLVYGSRFFSIPKGTSVLQVHISPWCLEEPKIKIEWQDAWL